MKFNNAFTTGNPSGIEGFGIVMDAFEDIKSEAYNVVLPEIQWNKCIPAGSIDRSVNIGARSASYKVKDRRGIGSFRASQGKDLPVVGAGMNKVTVPLESSSVVAHIDRDDINAVAFGHEGMNLITDYGVIMRESAERHIERTFFFGDDNFNYTGYIDHPLIPVTVSDDPGGGSEFINKTGEQMAFTINQALTAVWVGSKQAFIAGRVELPSDQFALIHTTRLATGVNGVAQTVAEFIMSSNIYKTVTGQELEIKPLRHLDGAGAGGTDRMRVTDIRDVHHWMPMPEDFTMLDPFYRGFETDLFASYKFGPYHIRQEISSLYVDGI